MTIFTTDRADSGEIPRIPGEIRRTVRLALPDAPGEATVNLAAKRDAILGAQHNLRLNDPTAEIPVIDLDETVIYRDELEGPQKPPPPLPPIPDEAGRDPFGGLGADLPQPDPEPEPDEDGDDIVFRRGCGGVRHQPQPGTRLACRAAQRAAVRTAVLWTALVTAAIYSGFVLAAVAVVR